MECENGVGGRRKRSLGLEGFASHGNHVQRVVRGKRILNRAKAGKKMFCKCQVPMSFRGEKRA